MTTDRARLEQGCTGALVQGGRHWRRLADAGMRIHGVSGATALPWVTTGRLDGEPRRSALAEAVGIEGPSLVRLLDQLEAAGLVTRREDPADRRAKVPSLTAEGRAAARIEGKLARLRRSVFAGVSRADHEAGLRALGAAQRRASDRERHHDRVRLARLGLRAQNLRGGDAGLRDRPVDRPAAALLGGRHRLHHQPDPRRGDALEGALPRRRHARRGGGGGGAGARPRRCARTALARHRPVGRRLPVLRAPRPHTPGSYLPMLAGYTAALVGFPSVSEPGAIFDTAVSRAEEITLGILCASLVSTLILPQSVRPVIAARLDGWSREARAWAAEGLGRFRGRRDGSRSPGCGSPPTRSPSTPSRRPCATRIRATRARSPRWRCCASTC